MAVHLTRIYTRTGDDGTTALGDMSRVRKTDPRLGAYADGAEANSPSGAHLERGPPPVGAAQRGRGRGAGQCGNRPRRRGGGFAAGGGARPGLPAATGHRG